MNARLLIRTLFAASLILGTLVLASCGGEDDGATGPVITDGTGGGDVITLSIDGGPEMTFTEASGLPNIDCDPRVDWGAQQVILWDDFTQGGGPNGYELFFEIMFARTDTVGTYTVHEDFCQALLYDGSNYSASPLLNTSSGTVQVTRSDTRIAGSFAITVVDAAETTTRSVSGRFDVDRGFSLSCP